MGKPLGMRMHSREITRYRDCGPRVDGGAMRGVALCIVIALAGRYRPSVSTLLSTLGQREGTERTWENVWTRIRSRMRCGHRPKGTTRRVCLGMHPGLANAPRAKLPRMSSVRVVTARAWQTTGTLPMYPFRRSTCAPFWRTVDLSTHPCVCPVCLRHHVGMSGIGEVCRFVTELRNA